MKIRKVDIKGFGKLHNIYIELGDGINLIYGENESGKTTIQAFIKAMFYGLRNRKTPRDGGIPQLKRYTPWKKSDFGGTMEYMLDRGQIFRIVRNFETGNVKVYDASYKDITNSFDVGRERNLFIAERQFGLNEDVFEKTVYIKQMELTFDDTYTGELLNRLINVSSTGFEDVSFKKAEKALKDALRIYVGNENTSSRPYDLVMESLNMYYAQKEELMKKRQYYLGIESELSKITIEKRRVELRKEIAARAREIIKARKVLEMYRHMEVEMRDIINDIKVNQDELKATSLQLEEAVKAKESLAAFSKYTIDDADNITMAYQRYLGMLEENRNLTKEYETKKNKFEALKHQMPMMQRDTFNERELEYKIIELTKDIENLKFQYEKANPETFDEQIKSIESVENMYKFSIPILIVFALISFAMFVSLLGKESKQPFDTILIFILVIVSIVCMVFTQIMFTQKKKSSNEKQLLMDKKSFAITNSQSIAEEIANKEKVQRSLFHSIGVSSYEDFIKRRSYFENLRQSFETMKIELVRLEKSISDSVNNLSMCKKSIIDILLKAGIVESRASEITEEHIATFRNCIRKYYETCNEINRLKEKIDYLNNETRNLYRTAWAKCGKDVELSEQIAQILNDFYQKISMQEGILKTHIMEAETFFAENPDSEMSFFDFKNNFISGPIQNMEELDIEFERTSQHLNDLLMQMREYETLLKGVDYESEDLQRIEEEIANQEEKKQELEKISFSLKTALEVLTASNEELQKNFGPAINIKMSKIIKKITANRYSDVRVDKQLHLHVLPPELVEEAVPVEIMSAGTIDQMYLALRIAAADVISHSTEKMPLILDEIFSQYDDKRIEETLYYFDELSQERQLIFFTCKRRESEIFRSLSKNLNIIDMKQFKY